MRAWILLLGVLLIYLAITGKWREIVNAIQSRGAQ